MPILARIHSREVCVYVGLVRLSTAQSNFRHKSPQQKLTANYWQNSTPVGVGLEKGVGSDKVGCLTQSILYNHAASYSSAIVQPLMFPRVKATWI